MKEEVSSAEADLMFENIQHKQLLKWFDKWGDSPWLYSMTKFVYKIPLYLLIWVAVSFQQVKVFIANPLVYIEQRGVYLLLGFILITFLYRIGWNHNAVKFYFLSKINPSFPQLDSDHIIVRIGKRAEERVPAKYERWIDKKLLIQSFFALLLPIAFFVIIFLLNGVSYGNWSIKSLTGGFENLGLLLMVIATFVLFGIALGYGFWRQVKDDYLLLNKAKI